MNMPLPTPPVSFSRENTFPYIAQVLAHQTFSQLSQILQKKHIQVICIDKNELEKKCVSQMHILQQKHPADSYYLRKYLHAFQYHIPFRNSTIQEIVEEYQHTLNSLASQKYCT